MPHRAEAGVALLTAASSLAPSLLPKTVPVQGVVTGLAAVVGYAFATLVRWLLTPLRRRLPPALRARIAWALFGLGVLSLAPAVWFGHQWRRDLAASVGMRDPPPVSAFGALLVALAVLLAALLVARAIRIVVRWLARHLARVLPAWLAPVLAAVLVLGLTAVTVRWVVEDRLLTAVDDSFRVVNQQVAPDRPVPADPLRSGGPGSLVDWADLGAAGREFVTLPAPSQGRSPVRVYAGIDSAADLTERAELVAAELARTGAFQRAVVCVVVPTGTGWVDGAAVTTLEALWRGDTAVASMQYSYLPSVLSMLTDRQRVEEAGVALVGAVVRRWLAIPEGERPRLVLFGESLGSRGVEAALARVPEAERVVDGVLLVGPPNSNPTWSRLVAERDDGSPLLAPVVDGGRSVRFWPGPELPQFDRRDDPWPAPPSGPRILYLQHPSDPVVWWSPELLWSEPEWSDERSLVARAPPLLWQPVVTFWQVSGDAVFATDVPSGHGHRYGIELADAWAALLPR